MTLTPPSAAPVCDAKASAQVWWAPQWRVDQKDVADRERRAAEGLRAFFDAPGCFAQVALQRAPDAAQALEVAQAVQAGQGRLALPDLGDIASVGAGAGGSVGPGGSLAGRRPDKGVVITLRELGPILKLGSSAALVEGGTEVLLEVDEVAFDRPGQPVRHLKVHWQHGGPGVVKGVASLADDLQAALAAGLQPGAARP